MTCWKTPCGHSTPPEDCPYIIVVHTWAALLHAKHPTCPIQFEQTQVPAWHQLVTYTKRFRPGFLVWVGPGSEDGFGYFLWQGEWETRALTIRAILAKSGHPILNPAAPYATMSLGSATQSSQFNRHQSTITAMVKLVCRASTFAKLHNLLVQGEKCYHSHASLPSLPHTSVDLTRARITSTAAPSTSSPPHSPCPA